jgi:hypothetical protein
MTESYDQVWTSSRHCLVQKDGLWGAVDREGAVLLPIEYAQVKALGRADFLCRKPGGRWAYLRRGRAVFQNADAVWVHRNQTGDRVRLVYLLTETGGLFRLYPADGRRLWNAQGTLGEMEALTSRLLGYPARFEKWLGVTER